MLNSKDRQPVPGPLCAAYAPLLPALDDLTDARLAEDTRAHLADCAWCRAQRATYDRFDEALRLQFAPDAMPVLSENLAVSLLGGASGDGGLATLVIPDDDQGDDDQDDDALQITVTPLPISPRSPHPPRQSLRLAAVGASLAAMLVISLLGGLLFLSHERLTPPASPRATAQTQTSTPSPPIPDTRVPLAAIGMASPTDGWAFSESTTVAHGIQTTTLHYTGGRWVKAQDKINGDIEAVKMLSPTDGWAVGSGVFHYDGKSWQQVDVGNLDGFQAISVVSPTDIWLAGMGHTSQPLIVHYDGHTWIQQRTPYFTDANVVNVTSLAMVSASEGWAVATNAYVPDCTNSYNNNCGVSEDTTSIVLHYDNDAWSVALTLPKYNLSSISMISANEGWFGGEKQVRNTTFPAIGSSAFSTKPTLWHYTGSHWIEVSPPQSAAGAADPVGQIKNITMFSPTDGWLFASLFDQAQTSDGAVTLAPDVFHLEAGHWVQIKTPAFRNRLGVSMLQVAFVSPDEFWGVGESMIPNPTDMSIAAVAPLILHYRNGIWSIIED